MRLDAAFPARFLRLLRDQRYTVVHSHVLRASGPILALAAAARVPVRIAHIHATHDNHASTAIRVLQRRIMEAMISGSATNIIGCGEGAIEALWPDRWRRDPRCEVVYDAVDPGRFDTAADRDAVRASLGIPHDARLFLHVGNEVAEKNHERLVRIASEIIRQDGTSWLVLAGAGTENPFGTSRRAVAQLGIGHRVRALGVRDDVPALMRAADLLLLPSMFEGLPGVVLEAAVVGLPTLASDLPGVREIATHLPAVRYLPLSVSDCEWASEALHLGGTHDGAAGERARRTFQTSVFHISTAVERHRQLWRGGVEAVPACS
jgi:glycosyltransferase involved in cell wall biosynthesis